LTPTIELRGLTLTHAGAPVVRALDWRAEAGTIAWVVGENGSGKSTLLSALAGRLTAAAGMVRLEPASGQVVWYHPRMAPPPETRVRDWHRLVSALVPEGCPPSLEPELRPRQRLGEVSTGEQRRLLLETLLRRKARFYLLDEPFEHLSPAAKASLTERLRERAQASVVIVATNQGTAAEGAAADGPPALRLLGGGAWRVDGAQ
jgi:ABC-type Mn2+/Zn2+ transport system ATPase subunit